MTTDWHATLIPLADWLAGRETPKSEQAYIAYPKGRKPYTPKTTMGKYYFHGRDWRAIRELGWKIHIAPNPMAGYELSKESRRAQIIAPHSARSTTLTEDLMPVIMARDVGIELHYEFISESDKLSEKNFRKLEARIEEERAKMPSEDDVITEIMSSIAPCDRTKLMWHDVEDRAKRLYFGLETVVQFPAKEFPQIERLRDLIRDEFGAVFWGCGDRAHFPGLGWTKGTTMQNASIPPEDTESLREAMETAKQDDLMIRWLEKVVVDKPDTENLFTEELFDAALLVDSSENGTLAFGLTQRQFSKRAAQICDLGKSKQVWKDGKNQRAWRGKGLRLATEIEPVDEANPTESLLSIEEPPRSKTDTQFLQDVLSLLADRSGMSVEEFRRRAVEQWTLEQIKEALSHDHS